MSTSIEASISRVLETSFGFGSLRPGQEEVIVSVLQGEAVVSVMPTGAGKSLCYQLPAALLAEKGGISIVVSPLIALMKDQVDSLLARGVRTAALTSAASPAEQTQILQGIRQGNYELIYVAPERFHSGRFMSALSDIQDRIALLAIDEAHCISEWGHDFRPAYRRLGQVIQELKPPYLLAVTATATPEVRADIAKQLGIPSPTLYVRGFSRPNLVFSVEHCGGAKDKGQRIIDRVLKRKGGSAVVYAATRKNAERYAADLVSAHVKARAYHAGLDDRQRNAIQDEFMQGDIDVIVATNAFGMGVDKTDVRLVVHADLPRSIEAYYQEAGRAGRDGDPADCVLLFNHGDVRLQEFLIDASFPSAALLRGMWKLLRENPGLMASQLSGYQLPGDPHDSTVSSALRILQRHGYVLDEMGSLEAMKPGQLPGDYPDFDPEASERRAEVERSKLKIMMEYSYHAACRHGFVLDYFGEERTADTQSCSACDNCQGLGEANVLTEIELQHATQLLHIIGELDGRFGRKRITGIAKGSDDDERFFGMRNRGALSDCTQKRILDLLRSLEAGRLIEQSRSEYPTLKLARSGKDIVAGRAEIDPELLRLLPSSKRAKPAKRGTTRKAGAQTMSDLKTDPQVAESLRSLRSELARENAVPAYVIFSNRTLDELSALKPTTLDKLTGIHGIGPSRVEKYGDAIVAAISASI